MIKLNIDPNEAHQAIIITITVKNKAKRVRFDIDHHNYTDKWYVGLFDMQEEKYYCVNVPMVASYKEKNDLFAPFRHKEIGELVCVPVVRTPSSEDPRANNLDEFMLVWGEEIA